MASSAGLGSRPAKDCNLRGDAEGPSVLKLPRSTPHAACHFLNSPRFCLFPVTLQMPLEENISQHDLATSVSVQIRLFAAGAAAAGPEHSRGHGVLEAWPEERPQRQLPGSRSQTRGLGFRRSSEFEKPRLSRAGPGGPRGAQRPLGGGEGRAGSQALPSRVQAA